MAVSAVGNIVNKDAFSAPRCEKDTGCLNGRRVVTYGALMAAAVCCKEFARAFFGLSVGALVVSVVFPAAAPFALSLMKVAAGSAGLAVVSFLGACALTDPTG